MECFDISTLRGPCQGLRIDMSLKEKSPPKDNSAFIPHYQRTIIDAGLMDAASPQALHPELTPP